MASVHVNGRPIDATFSIRRGGAPEEFVVTFNSATGARLQRPARNGQYQAGLDVLLARLRQIDATVTAVWLAPTQGPWSRTQLDVPNHPYPWRMRHVSDVERLRKDLGRAQEWTNRNAGAKGSGNRTRRIDIVFTAHATGATSEIERWLASGEGLPSAATRDPALHLAETLADVDDIATLIEEPPCATQRPSRNTEPRSRHIEWAAQDAKNQQLGAAGERFVSEFERRALVLAGRPDLSLKVEIKAQSEGDGLGYDVLSFTPEGQEKFIEVKTTAGAKTEPFFITANELRCSLRYGGQFWLYRVFGPPERRRIFQLRGPLTDQVDLEPAVYRAVAKAGR